MLEVIKSVPLESEPISSSASVEQQPIELPTGASTSLRVQPLGVENEPEVLAFLAGRPAHTVFILGFIHDNGLESPLNRGTFYGYRDGQGRLEGVALIGHVTLVEARTQDALEAFARVAQECPFAHMIL